VLTCEDRTLWIVEPGLGLWPNEISGRGAAAWPNAVPVAPEITRGKIGRVLSTSGGRRANPPNRQLRQRGVSCLVRVEFASNRVLLETARRALPFLNRPTGRGSQIR
jgi:hypothetical protein